MNEEHARVRFHHGDELLFSIGFFWGPGSVHEALTHVH